MGNESTNEKAQFWEKHKETFSAFDIAFFDHNWKKELGCYLRNLENFSKIKVSKMPVIKEITQNKNFANSAENCKKSSLKHFTETVIFA